MAHAASMGPEGNVKPGPQAAAAVVRRFQSCVGAEAPLPAPNVVVLVADDVAAEFFMDEASSTASDR
eukprot:11227535-Lingulodinium_polyedra.AAC.1